MPEFTPIEKALSVLKNDGVILHLTDTIWGLAALADSEIAVAKVREIKKRSLEKSFILLFADTEIATEYMPEKLSNYLAENAFTTYISTDIKNIDPALYAKDGSLAVRIPQFQQLQELLKQLGKPIISTSANLSGKPSPQTFNDISTLLINDVDFVLPSEEHAGQRQPSKIIRLLKNGRQEIIR